MSRPQITTLWSRKPGALDHIAPRGVPTALEPGFQERIHDLERSSIDSILASLCARIIRAENVSTQTPHRIPGTFELL